MTDIPALFDDLRKNAPRFAETSAKERADKIGALTDAVLSSKERLFEASAQERGTCDMDVAAELMMLKMESDFIRKKLPKWLKKHKVRNSMASFGKRSYIMYEPKGVGLNLSTWNAPAVIGLYPLLPAIAAGNTVCLKPSELAPHSATVLREIVESVFPANEFAVVEGGPETAGALLEQPFNHIYFTGGHRVGKIVMEKAAQHFSSITLEMGGKSPVIIDKSVNLENAAKKIAWGRLANAGQMCVACDYVLAPREMIPHVVEALRNAINEMYNPEGAGFDKAPEFARIINDAHFGRIVGLLDDATANGAKVEMGGGHDAANRYIEPTLLTGVTEDMRIMNEEVFGPVLPIIAYDARDEVIEMVNKRTKPLALYIYATDRAAIDWYLAHTSAGSTVVNHNCVQSGTNPNLPFGGVGHSGQGRMGGFRGFQEWSNARSVMEQPLDRLRDIAVNLPPYSDRYTNLVMKGLTPKK